MHYILVYFIFFKEYKNVGQNVCSYDSSACDQQEIVCIIDWEIDDSKFLLADFQLSYIYEISL